MTHIFSIAFCALSTTAAALKIPKVPPKERDVHQSSSGSVEFARLETDYVSSKVVHKARVNLDMSQRAYFTHKTLDSTFKIGTEKSNKCLSFMHIPKNAGTAVEDDLTRYVVSSQDTSVRHWGRHDTALNCTIENSNGKKCIWYSETPEGTRIQHQCFKWHMPPHIDPVLAASYTADGCETFCVTRSPSEKFFSQLAYQDPVLRSNCNMESFHTQAIRSMQMVRKDPYWAQCHFIPQTEFIYGESDEPKYCKHILRHENLKQDFTDLMKKFEIPLTLARTRLRSPQQYTEPPKKVTSFMDLSSQGVCKLPLQERDADKEVHDFIFSYYRDDLRNFHYDL